MNEQQREAGVQRMLRLPYHRVIHGDTDEGYMGEVPELPGCLTAGNTPAEALANLEEAMAAWIESCLVSGDPIPGPARALAPVAWQFD
ncbi:MAG: type II toxin-antitoxin system HicB family antitoxin [Dehalococcoidia bacterium]